MKIEIGEYIRTKQGIIDKVILEYTGKCANPNCTKKHISCKLNYYDEEDIVSHSKDIIDLIEVGDFVNGNKVHSVDYSISIQTGEKYLVIDKIYQSVKYFYEKDIKSIVTKQQFDNMEYKV